MRRLLDHNEGVATVAPCETLLVVTLLDASATAAC